MYAGEQCQKSHSHDIPRHKVNLSWLALMKKNISTKTTSKPDKNESITAAQFLKRLKALQSQKQPDLTVISHRSGGCDHGRTDGQIFALAKIILCPLARSKTPDNAISARVGTVSIMDFRLAAKTTRRRKAFILYEAPRSINGWDLGTSAIYVVGSYCSINRDILYKLALKDTWGAAPPLSAQRTLLNMAMLRIPRSPRYCWKMIRLNP
jgi:hypothetical protein